MPKNIILCSDGTGNSGGKGYNTNVWRIVNAINRHPRPDLEQVAFYDDGVGSQDYKFLRTLGGVFGWGISRNLCQLYAFLMLHYEPGDRIYLFGFSRGAFTIRSLGNMIRYCGVAKRDGLSVHGLMKLAGQALELYKNRSTEDCQGPDADGGDDLKDFKESCGRFCNDEKTSKDVPIEFIGVWDTVEALGLPVEELKHSLDRWFKLQFRDGENDLNPRVRYVYHALSIDDERQTFHPTLFDESFKRGDQVVEQVWFAGVHANVGGGYPKDQLSLVALVWMMKKAYDCGLEFHPSAWAEYQCEQDLHGAIYDPRAGLGMYYRYGPRDIRRICEKYHVPVHKIHAGVFERIKQGTQAYAPTGVPKDYEVEPKGTPKPETDERRDKRHHQLRIVRDIAWWRTKYYYLMLTWTLALVGFCIAFSEDTKVPDFADWDAVRRWLYFAEEPLIDVMTMIVPGVTLGLNALRHHPYALPIFLVPFVGFFWRNWVLENMTRNLSVRAWHMSLATHPEKVDKVVSPRKWWIRLARFFRDNPLIATLTAWRDGLFRWLAPWITRLAVFGGCLAIFCYLVWTVTGWTSLAMNPAPSGDDGADFTFDTRNSLHPTTWNVEDGATYYITVTVLEPWKDNGRLTDPEGFDAGEDDWTLKAFSFTRRDPNQKWFKLMAAVGDDSQVTQQQYQFRLLPDTSKKHEAGPKKLVYQLIANKKGRLYLFVNDTFGCYYNNEGTARIHIKQGR